MKYPKQMNSKSTNRSGTLYFVQVVIGQKRLTLAHVVQILPLATHEINLRGVDQY
jgi:hypothetical protein